MAINLVFGTSIELWSSLPNAILALFETIIGQSRPWEEMLEKTMPFSLQFVGWMYFASFCFMMILIVTNLFVSVIAYSYQVTCTVLLPLLQMSLHCVGLGAGLLHYRQS